MQTVCIIDDDEAVRESTGLLLSLCGYAVEGYETTRDFLNAHPGRDGAVLLLDQHLPQQTGLEFLESDEGRGLCSRVVLMTGQGSAKLRARAIADGVAGYLEKPIDVDRLLQIFARLGTNRVPRAAGTPGASP
jgi:two-component system response regulator FixJ